MSVLRQTKLKRVEGLAKDDEGFSYRELSGRLCEVQGKGAAFTLAASFVRQAQQMSEPVAWLSSRKSTFYPPDLVLSGIDIEALVCVRVDTDRHKNAIARSADQLLRSGAFGLVVLDFEHEKRDLPMPLLTRLSGLCRKHQSALVFLRKSQREESGLGSLISLRIEAIRDDAERLILTSLKDKRRAPYRRQLMRSIPPPGFRRASVSVRRLQIKGAQTLRLVDADSAQENSKGA